MTKTLTEQWREGTLPEGYYYTKGAFDDDIYISYFDYEIEEDKRLPVEEVLAPVPSYDELKRLQEQLADANKTIDYYDKKDFHYTLADGTVMGKEPAHKYKVKWGVK